MSEFTAVGPALDLDGPLPVAPEYGLLSVPGVLQENPGRRLNGVNVIGYPTATPLAWEPCSSGTFRQKEEGEDQPQERFDPVGLYVPITCSAMNFGSRWREFAARAELVLEVTLSFGVEAVLSQGVIMSTNPFLGDGNVIKLNAGAATAALNALAFLEQAVAATGRRGIIHTPAQVLPHWADRLRVVGEHLETFNGTYVAVGGGYDGALANGTAAGAGNAWAFATGPVEVFVGESQLSGDDINGTLDTSNNDVTFRAERYVVAEWDGALQAAVNVDWTP